MTHRHLSDHLSEIVETTLSDLQQSKVCLVHVHYYYFLTCHRTASHGVHGLILAVP